MKRRFAVLTSGGDAPGMNAAIRAVVRTGLHLGYEVVGIHDGYKGLLSANFRLLTARDVGGIIHQGGTILGSARCPEFKLHSWIQEARTILEAADIDGLVVVGGNGSQSGAAALATTGFPVVGIASTIDNDLLGTEISIGVDSALNVALEAIDRIKITASSHHRAFLVEVMGRNCGYLALAAGIAGGAEAIVMPEVEMEPQAVIELFREAYQRGKAHAIGVVAEGARYNAATLAQYCNAQKDQVGFDLRVVTLGHVQRGGAPGAFDRLLATRFGVTAIECLHHDETGVLVGLQKGQIVTTPYALVAGKTKGIDQSLIRMIGMLAA
ncbi:MAG TPA: ATP-dependent 6-phosphofructokinase [Chthoniobacterales bacterium]|nr:ATP-dependent 6-phosphofructokinase [Chthoniobacterales bacterium]